MSGRYDADDEAFGQEDPEGPQKRDLVDEDEEETPTVPCPSCGRDVPDFADRCPYCGDWIVQASGESSHGRVWLILAALAALVGFLWWQLC